MTTSERPTAASLGRFQLILLLALVLQNTATVLVGRYTRTKANEEDLYDLNQFLLVSECVKLGLSLLLEYLLSDGEPLWASLRTHIWQRPLEALKMAVPAALYLASNNLLYSALSNLTVPVYQIISQGKLVVTALVSVGVLHRRYSAQQWMCLLLISCGVAVIAIEEKSDKEDQNDNHDNLNVALGLSALSISCLCSSFAGVYFEKVVKKGDSADSTTQPSLWMRNIQLSLFSILSAAGRAVYTYLSAPNSRKSFLHGFDGWVWLQVSLFGVGGLLVAGVIKHADNVLKGMATAMSILVATICSMFLFNTSLTKHFFIGATMIIPSVYLYSNPCQTSQHNQDCCVTSLRHFSINRVNRFVNLSIVIFVALTFYYLRFGAHCPLLDSALKQQFPEFPEATIGTRLNEELVY